MPRISFRDADQWLIRTKIREMHHYLDELTKALTDMEGEFRRRTDEEAARIKDEREREDFYSFSDEEYWRYKDTFPRILLNSFHVAAYSLLESETLEIGRRIGKKQRQVFDVSDIKRGDYLISASYYIEKLTGIRANQPPMWSKLKDAQRIRNIIAHEDGRLTEPDDIKTAKRLRVFNDDLLGYPAICVTVDYAKSFLDSVLAFLAGLISQVEEGNHT